MAYARKYLLEFTNVQHDIYHAFISEKDYIGGIIALRGATDKPFTTSQKSGDDNVFNATRAKECTVNFVAENGISLLNFYSEDDEQFRIDFYCHEVNGNIIDKLLSSFFLLQDSCEQDYAAEPFEVTLKGTDNIGLLKDVPFTTTGMPYHPTNGSNYLGDISLFDYIKIALQQTGLADLPLRVYSNIFENTTDDRSVDITAEMLQETFLFTGKYLNDDGTWQDLYTIVTDILTTLNCCLCQENGAWNITRLQEATLFANNAIPGVEHDLTTGAKTAITLDANLDLVYQSDNALDAADQRTRIQRPYKFVKETFNFQQPESFIANADLQLPVGAVPYSTTTIGDVRYDKYSLATYFPAWKQTNADASYLQIEYNLTEKREQDRYIYTPGDTTGGGGIADVSGISGIQFNPIPVTQGDSLDFSLQFKMLTSDSNTLRFWVRFILIKTNSTHRELVNDPGNTGAGIYWDAGGNAIFWDENAGFYYEIAASKTKTEWTTWSFTSINGDVDGPIKFPSDGMLLIEVRAANGGNPATNNRQDIVWKDINLDIQNYINDSTLIAGQYHDNEQTLAAGQQIKNNYDEDIDIDDSPRNTIAGTLFTDALTNFDFTDDFTGNETGIGDIHFTRTILWHRASIAEERRLGEIIVLERMMQAYKARTIMEGTLYGLRHQLNSGEWNFISLLNIITVDSLPGLHFMFGVLETDWMNATYKAVLNELYADADAAFAYSYIFQYIYKTT